MRRKKGALEKPNSGEEEKRGGRVHSQSKKKKTGGGCCEKEGAFVVRRGRRRKAGGRRRSVDWPMSASLYLRLRPEHHPGGQAGQSESELCRATVTTFRLPARSRFGWRYGGSLRLPFLSGKPIASYLSVSVSRTDGRLEFRSVPHPPPSPWLLVPTPTPTDELDSGLCLYLAPFLASDGF